MEDLRLVEIQEREGQTAFGVKEVVGTLVGGGILMMVGLYAYSKVGGKIDILGGQYFNSTHYCASGTINGTTNCLTGTMTQMTSSQAADYTALDSVKTNITGGFDLASIVFYMVAVVAILGTIWVAFR